MSERTRRVLAYKASKGERVGQIPFGSRLAADGVSLVEDEAERELVECVLAYRAEGLSYRAIAERLNAEDRPARGKRWHTTTVRRLVVRETA